MCLYVNKLSKNEGNQVKSILRSSKNRVAIKRAQVILLSAQGYRVQEIAQSVYLTEEYIRKLIRDFNKERAEIFKIRRSPGQPVQFTEEIKSEIIEISLSPPRLLRLPFNRWSLEKLKEYLISKKIVKTISIETIRTILKENKISYQRTKTWKESNDPEFEIKKNE